MHHTEFTVQWEVQVDGTSPRDAAKAALAIQRDPESRTTVFTVIDQRGIAHKVDLEETEVGCCPFCQSTSILTGTREWKVSEPTGTDDRAPVVEHLCNDCNKSFWS